MKRIVWTYGLISGAIMAAFMAAILPFANALDEHSLLLGYAGMVAGFLCVFFGVRSYRDNVRGGSIGFGRALGVGLLIALIGSICYVAAWEVMFYKFMPDFYARYAQSVVAQAQSSGESPAEIAQIRAGMDAMVNNASNPLWVAAMTFVEPLPVAILVSLISAAILRRRRGTQDAVLATG